MSIPMTLPFLPTVVDNKKQSMPAPEPRSNTVSPCFNESMASGFPHPNPRFDSSGIESSSSSLYPIFLLMLTGEAAGPQHEILGAQQEAPLSAIPAYPSLTILLMFLIPPNPPFGAPTPSGVGRGVTFFFMTVLRLYPSPYRKLGD